MRPFALLALFSCLCSVLAVHVAQAQVPELMTAGASQADVLNSSALPEPEISTGEYPAFTNPWVPHGPADYIGVELGVIGLVRQKPTAQVIATDDLNRVLLNANELQGDMQFGLAAKIDVYQISNAFGGTDLQLGYFGINSLDATRTLQAPQVRTRFFQGTTADPISSFNYIYSSNLYSGEANFRLRNTKRFRPLIGTRYLKLEDTFDQFSFRDGGGRDGFFSLTNNSLYGAQLGFESTVLRYRNWDWFAIGKYGAMHNRVEGSARAALGTTDAVKNYDGTNFSSLVDVQTGIIYRYVEQLQFRAAYQALYCSDIASGIDQSAAISFIGLPDQVVFDSRFWQGVSLSATISF